MAPFPIFEAAELRDMHCGPSNLHQERFARARRQKLLTSATNAAVMDALDLGGHLPQAAVVAGQENILAVRTAGDRRDGTVTNPTCVEMLALHDAMNAPFTQERPISVATNFEPSPEALDYLAETGIREVIFCIQRTALAQRHLVEDSIGDAFQRKEWLKFPFKIVWGRDPANLRKNQVLLEHTRFSEEHGRPIIDDVSALQYDLDQLAA